MVPKRSLGKTGFQASLLGLGGQITVEHEDPQAEAIIHKALDLGVNYIDTSPRYGDTVSETNIGRVMAHRRSEAFLATKTIERTYDGVMRQIDESLHRLQTDYLDLYQMHNLRLPEELQTILSPSGALKAFEQLQEQGTIRYMGITGHKDPALMMKAMESHPFDTILMPLNVGDVHFTPFQTQVLQKAAEKNLGIIAMKVAAKGKLNPGKDFTMEELLGYVCTLPITAAIVGVAGVKELEENVRIIQSFTPFSKEQMASLEKRSEKLAYPANFFKHEW